MGLYSGVVAQYWLKRKPYSPQCKSTQSETHNHRMESAYSSENLKNVTSTAMCVFKGMKDSQLAYYLSKECNLQDR